MITKKQSLSIIYFIIRTFFLGIGFSTLVQAANQDAWISIVLGIFIGLLIVLIYQSIMDNKNGKDINLILNEMKTMGVIIRIALILFISFLMIETILILETYCSSFYLPFTPVIALIIPVLLLTYYVCNKGISVIGRMCEILLPISLFLYIISFISLIPMVNLNNFLPILTTHPMQIITSAISIGVSGACPFILLLSTNSNGKKIIPTYLVNMLIIFSIVFLTIGVLGPALSNTFRFPEYMVLKRIKLLNFIEKIENILAIQWIIDCLITIFLAGYFSKKLMPVKKNNWYFIVFLLLIGIITTQIFGKSYYLDLLIMHKTTILMFGFFILSVVPIFIYLSKKCKISKK